MEKKINIAELLKDCPSGMELDCTLYDNATFGCILDDNRYPIKIQTPEEHMLLSKYGCLSLSTHAKCVIFPKGKTTWEGFQRPFKDGDIVFTTLGNIAIIRKPIEEALFSVYGIMVGNGFYKDETAKVVVERHATEEEKQKLFNAIKNRGYKWNTENKTLEKLPKFKDGDIVSTLCGGWIGIVKKPFMGAYETYITIFDEIVVNNNSVLYFDRFATEEEKEKLFNIIKANGYKWNPETKTLEKLVQPKFKPGDKVKDKNNRVWFIVHVSEKHFDISCVPNAEGYFVPIEDQDDYELINEPKFKDGDILYAMDEGKEFIFILKHIFENGRVYCYLSLKGDDLRLQEVWLTDYNPTHRLATEEEKQKLFDAIKSKGYKWNAENNTLKKLNESSEDVDDEILMSGIYFDRKYYADEVELHLDNYNLEIRDGRVYAVFKNQIK